MEASRDAANAELTQARALAPQGERKQPPDEFIEYLFYEVKYMRNDEVEDAYANFEAAVAADPTSDLPYLAMGEGYRMSAGLLNAEQSYQAAIAAAPSDINGYLHLGKLYMMTNRRQEAYEQYERAAQVIPGSAVPHLYLAGWYRVQEDMPAAELEYQTAITMVPGEVRSYLRLAELYQSLDRENDVMEQYMNATQIGLPVEISICGPGRLPSSSVGIDTIEIFAANALSSESWRCEWDQRPWSSMTVDEAN
jgi:Tfp pilus assembly protein PilF